MQVGWAPIARFDLASIRDYIGEDNPIAAQRVGEAIAQAADSLAQFPFKGHEGEQGTREWVVPAFPRYLLIYEVDPQAGMVTILRVWRQWLPR